MALVIIFDQSSFFHVGEDLGNKRSPHFSVLVSVLTPWPRFLYPGLEEFIHHSKDIFTDDTQSSTCFHDLLT